MFRNRFDDDIATTLPSPPPSPCVLENDQTNGNGKTRGKEGGEGDECRIALSRHGSRERKSSRPRNVSLGCSFPLSIKGRKARVA